MRTYRLGFNLVELLVVIAIISILMAVSFGAITAGIKYAQTAKCSSNMRQIGVGFQGYLADNNNVMPQRYYGSTTDAGTGTGYWVLLAPYTGSSTNNASTSVFVCPTFTSCSFPSEPSYGMNWYYDNTSVTIVPGLANTIMVAETLGSDGTGSNRADQNNNDPGELDPKRHNGYANYLFFDGHIEKLQFTATTNMWGTDMGNHNQTTPP